MRETKRKRRVVGRFIACLSIDILHCFLGELSGLGHRRSREMEYVMRTWIL